MSTSGHLPSITMANGSKVSSHGVGTVHPFPSLPIDNVLYVPGSPFNLLSINRLIRSLDCIIFFTKDFGIKSNLGFQYFVTFIDNYLRCFQYFNLFFNEIKNQFGVSIRILESDNAREYLSQSFTTFMKSHGILYQTSCGYTPQQTGVAERKNRHLVETTRTLLIHGVFLNVFEMILFLVHVILLIVCHLQF